MDKLLFRALGVMLVVSLGINIALAWSVTARDSEIVRLTETVLQLKDEARLARGTDLPPLEGEDAEGESWYLDWTDSRDPTLLYAYSSTCTWCAKNLENIRLLGDMIRSGYRVIGLSLSPTPVTERPREVELLGFPVLFELSEASLQAYRLGGTPQTLLISTDGTLMKSWTGAYTGRLQAEIEEYFSVRLPGLLDSAAPGG